jgi:hypothetical protein
MKKPSAATKAAAIQAARLLRKTVQVNQAMIAKLPRPKSRDGKRQPTDVSPITAMNPAMISLLSGG